MDPQVKILYEQILESSKQYLFNDIKSSLLLKHDLPEDILWLIGKDLVAEFKREPICKPYYEEVYRNMLIRKGLSYTWTNNKLRYKYDLPTEILCYEQQYMSNGNVTHTDNLINIFYKQYNKPSRLDESKPCHMEYIYGNLYLSYEEYFKNGRYDKQAYHLDDDKTFFY